MRYRVRRLESLVLHQHTYYLIICLYALDAQTRLLIENRDQMIAFPGSKDCGICKLDSWPGYD